MASQPVSSTSSAQRSSAVSSLPSSFLNSTSSSSISQRVSSQAASSSSFPSSRATSSSPHIPTTSPSTRPQPTSTSFPTNHLPSTSIPQSSSSQIPSHAAIADAQVTPLSHRPGVIAAIAASIVAVLLVASLVFFLCRRRRIRQMQVGSSTSQHPFMQEYPRDEDPKGWKDSPSSANGSGWPEDVTPIPLRVDRQTRQSFSSSVAGKAPHYTVRSHASMTDVYGFGQDVAWREAHYEDPLPVVHPSQPATPMHPEIDVIPPTPPSGIIHHNMPSAMLLRSPSTASSVSSEYSTASMVLPEPSVASDIPKTPQDMPHEGQGSRRLV